ncbi:MAG: transferrin-binding protein-like solute binding protein [Planktomarina sp.]
MTNGTTGALSAATSTGALDQSTGTLTVSQGPYAFVSNANAYTPTGLISDSAGATLLANAGMGANYEYLVVYNGTFTDGGVNYDTVGVLGPVTATADVRTSGTATYSGSANLSVVTQNGFSRLYTDGTTSISVNFATSNADMTLNNFTITNRSGQATNSSEFDTLSINGMAISGSNMSGGTFAFTQSGQQVDIVGTNTSETVHGTFYGYDEVNNIPDEVGGIVLVSGDTGQVTGVFVAD